MCEWEKFKGTVGSSIDYRSGTPFPSQIDPPPKKIIHNHSDGLMLGRLAAS